MTKKEFYTNLIVTNLSNGWGTTHEASHIIDQTITTNKPLGDRSWGQGYYGMFIYNLEDEVLKIKLITEFIRGTNEMLFRSGGVFLRDNSDEAYQLYKTDTFWEASKDQILGLVCGLFAMYLATNHEILRKGIREIVEKVRDHLIKHHWFLYNEKEKRGYDSANYCHVHYWGLRTAFNYMLKNQKFHALELLMYPTRKLWTKLSIDNMVAIKNKKKWWQNISWLKKYGWYGDYFRAGMYDFNLNLNFFEMFIVSMVSKDNAIWVKTELEKQEVMETNNLNFASLYFHICKKWSLIPQIGSIIHYSKLQDIDQLLHPPDCLPNEIGVGCFWKGHDYLLCHEIYDYSSLDIKYDHKTIEDLIDASKGKSVLINLGIAYMARRF